MTYACLSKSVVCDGELTLAAVQPENIEAIRLCRNAQMDVLRQSAPITPDQQTAYYAASIWPDMPLPQPRNILFVYLESGKFIGYGGLVHIAWEHCRAEVSFLLEPGLAQADEIYGRYFSAFLRLIQTVAFDDLQLHRLFTETYATRAHHIAVLESSRFRREGTLKDHVRIQGKPVDSLIHGCVDGRDRSKQASG
jgi:RimJ/RimL family protein N-acetyltransferase